MPELVHDFHEGNLHFQEKFDTKRLAARIAEKRVKDTLEGDDRKFVENADMFFLATCDDRGLPTCSYKGGDPGFITVVDETTIAFPNYDGNGKYQSMGNLLKNPNLGILFIDFENQLRMRLQGIASIEDDDELMPKYPGAQFIVRVAITEVYSNCPRYIHKYQLVERSKYVPRKDQPTPVPEWKRSQELSDVLPKGDSPIKATD